MVANHLLIGMILQVVGGKPINHAESVWSQTEMEVEMVMILLMVQKYSKLTS